MSDAIIAGAFVRPEPLHRFHPQVRKAMADARAERSRLFWTALQALFGRHTDHDGHDTSAVDGLWRNPAV